MAPLSHTLRYWLATYPNIYLVSDRRKARISVSKVVHARCGVGQLWAVPKSLRARWADHSERKGFKPVELWLRLRPAFPAIFMTGTLWMSGKDQASSVLS